MIIPTYEALIGQLLGEGALIVHASGSPTPRFNPRHYKFYWRVFTLESRYEGDEFLRRAPRLTNAQYRKERERLYANRIAALVYNLKLPRRDPANPFDMSHPKWKNAKFAPSWDDDKDPVMEGGHK